MTDSIAELLNYTLRLADKIAKPAGKCLVYLDIAGAFLELGNKSLCLATLADTLTILERLKNPAEKANLLAWMARIYSATGKQAPGQELFTRATLLARAAESVEQKLAALYRIAGEYADAGLSDRAVSILTELQAEAINPDNQIDTAAELINIAEIFIDLGQEDKADAILQEALAAVAGGKDSWLKAERWTEIAEIYAATGKKNRASPILTDLLSIIDQLDRVSQPHFLLKTAEILAASGENEEARQTLMKARKAIDRDELPYSRASLYLETAGQYTELGDNTTAASLLTQVADIIGGLDDNKDRIAGYIRIAGAAKRLGENQRALDSAKQASSLCQSITDHKAQLYLLGNLALLYFELDVRNKAEEIISGIIRVVQEADTKTTGLGVIAAELAGAGESLTALRLARVIREPEAKTSALLAICRSLVETPLQPIDEIKQIIREIVHPSPGL